MLTTGLDVPGSLYIPPNQKNWITEGYCSEECTAEVWTPDCFIFSTFLVVNNEIAVSWGGRGRASTGRSRGSRKL